MPRSRASSGTQRAGAADVLGTQARGQPLYRLARAGVTVRARHGPSPSMTLELLGLEADRLDLRVLCSKGTYVRVLGEDIAVALGSCGHLASLRREYVEPFAAEAMVTLGQLEAATTGRGCRRLAAAACRSRGGAPAAAAPDGNRCAGAALRSHRRAGGGRRAVMRGGALAAVRRGRRLSRARREFAAAVQLRVQRLFSAPLPV